MEDLDGIAIGLEIIPQLSGGLGINFIVYCVGFYTGQMGHWVHEALK